MPVSPRSGEESTSKESNEFAFGFLFGNPAHSSGLFFGESDFDVVGDIISEYVMIKLVHELLYDILFINSKQIKYNFVIIVNLIYLFD